LPIIQISNKTICYEFVIYPNLAALSILSVPVFVYYFIFQIIQNNEIIFDYLGVIWKTSA